MTKKYDYICAGCNKHKNGLPKQVVIGWPMLEFCSKKCFILYENKKGNE